jgi:hypothetical protein
MTDDTPRSYADDRDAHAAPDDPGDGAEGDTGGGPVEEPGDGAVGAGGLGGDSGDGGESRLDEGSRDAASLVASLETRSREGESPVASCAYCGRPFADQSAHDLHVGEVHDGVATDAERASAGDAAAAERDELFYFHLRVVGAIAVLYTVLVLLYMIALGSGLL